jgi:2-oxoisovalerate dehydrogenase E1 component
MPKSLLIDPTEARLRGILAAPEIPLNAYVPDPAAEARIYGSANLVRIFRDMVLIREFETMLDRIKKEGRYEGVSYNHKGPAHLSIGQEASAVGLCYHLTADDQIFGSHRSHGEIIAKCLSAAVKMTEADVLAVMEGYMGGAALRVAEQMSGLYKQSDIWGLAIDYVLYGTLAEIFGRSAGFNKGMGGSMHAFFPPFGVMPNNAIVGGSADIATGAALFKRINRRPGIVIANIGDASMGCGPVWEAMNFAAMDQFHTLWDPSIGGHPPILFNFIDNFYGMGGQPKGETMGFGVLARAGLGINPAGMHAERVDGYNPLAVADAIERKRRVLDAGDGPVLLDCVTYRFSGHSPSDASSYRDASEVKLWQQQDALNGYRDSLIGNGHIDQAGVQAIRQDAVARVRRALEAAVSLEMSPRLSVAVGDPIGSLMFSNRSRERLGQGAPTVSLPKSDSRLEQLRGKFRSALDSDGKPHPRLKTLTYAEALTEALLHRFYQDPSMVAYGEENRDWGGAFGVYRGLTEVLPYHRLFNAPISEAAIVGTAVGYALGGGRVVVELMYADFLGRAGDEIFNQMAKWQAMSGGALELPLVLRVSVGSKYGAQHSQDWSALVAHVPGLQVMFPATPYDAKGMLSLALHGTDPVVFFESQRLYSEPERLVAGGVPVDYYEVPLGEPAVRRAGSDVTLITIGATLHVALAAAGLLEAHGVSAEVIDLRFLNPLNYQPLVESTRKTGKVLIAADACERGSFAHTVASNLSQLAFDALDGPIVVLGARNWITPPAELEEAFFPQPEWIVDALHERILPLPGHVAASQQAASEIMVRNRRGV